MKIVLGFEACSQAAEFHVNTDNLNGKLGDLLQLGGGRYLLPRLAVPGGASLNPNTSRHTTSDVCGIDARAIDLVGGA